MTLIFDLDGTLLNTIADLGEACNHALAANGYPTHPLEDYPRLVGNGVNKLLERALPEGHKDEATVLRLREDFIPYYDRHNCCHTRPYDGIPELLAALRAKGHHLAVASNKYDAATRQLVEHYFGHETFFCIEGEKPGRERKPNPAIVHDILAQRPQGEACLYIGDSDVDIMTAHNAGLTAIACSWGFCSREKLEACHPEHIIEQPSELLLLDLLD